VLKKTGIVVATAAAGLLAMSPLAFAGDSDDHDRDWDRDRGSDTSLEVERNTFQRDNFELRDNEFCNNETEFGVLPPLLPGVLPQNIQCSNVEIDILSSDAEPVPPVEPPVEPPVVVP
jgi:hypothetical protein